MSNADIFRTYLERFTGGDVEGAAELLADEFAFDGPILQAKDKAEFLAGSAAAAAMARGCTIHHQWVDGDEVCSIYDFEIETPAGAGADPDGRVVGDPRREAGVVAAAVRHGGDGRADAGGLTNAMPPNAWTGYGRFCPLARALDVVGERWTLVIVQELLKRPSRYSELARRLPGIGTNVLADRLRKLEAAGVVERIPGAVGEGVVYALTDRGRGLSDALEALRRWGVGYLTDPTADGGARHEFDLHYVEGIDALRDAEFGLVIDGEAHDAAVLPRPPRAGRGSASRPGPDRAHVERVHGPLGCRHGQLGRRPR